MQVKKDNIQGIIEGWRIVIADSYSVGCKLRANSGHKNRKTTHPVEQASRLSIC